LLPVIQALRVEPVDAIKTGHLVAKGGGLASTITLRQWTARVLTRMPLRNLLLAPRRTVFTLLGIAAAITLLVLIMGMLDSFDATLRRARSELLQTSPQRMVVQLDFFYPSGSPVVAAMSQASTVSAADPSLQLGGYLMHNGATIETLLEMVNMDSHLWRPTVTSGAYPGTQLGVLISENAARDLGVRPGDTITLRHPQRTGLFSYGWKETEVNVSGIHALPLRFETFMDIQQAGVMGLEGLTNALQVIPASGMTQDQVKQQLFDQAGVASIQPISALIRLFEELIGEFVAIFSVLQVVVVILALLIAYNSTSINLDERAREMATMFAFGVRIRTGLRVAVVETLLTSVLGTVLGCGLGIMILTFMLNNVFAEVIADFDIHVMVHPVTFGVALIVGVMVAVLTPILNLPKMLRMDIPSTLRVME